MKTTLKTKITSLFRCSHCDAQFPKWSGQCFECSAWGTVEEINNVVPPSVRGVGGILSTSQPAQITTLDQIETQNFKRVATGIGEIDRVFGDGMVPGSVTLLGGEPGIGKSTLALGIAALVAKISPTPLIQGGFDGVIYASGEESGAQIKMRAERMGVTAKKLFFVFEQDLQKIIAAAEKQRPTLLVIDSVQTMFDQNSQGEAGSVSQIKNIAGRLVAFAKNSETSVIIIGHITKDGGLAGPKTLEHLVDVVLSFEGERSSQIRFLRSLKNRFGSTDEIGIFSMRENGLAEVKNPSALLLEENITARPGSILTCLVDGVRPMLVEVQALVQKTSQNFPIRRANGIDPARLEMILAILNRHTQIDLSSYDVFVNIAGGIKSKEPATDLAVALALVSSYKNKLILEKTIAWGELGLGGELRLAGASDKRLAEALNLGCKILFTSSSHNLKTDQLKIEKVKTIKEAVALI